LFAHVQALHRDALPWEFSDPDALAAEQLFTQQLADPEVLVLLAHRDEKPLGYLFGKELHRRANAFTTATSIFYVHHMAVAPDARRSGVGRALMGAAEAEAAKRGLVGVRLNTWAFNTSAHRFFERLGYAPYSINLQRMFDRSDER
jgi:GNAT superfamily N-acetyltransferase